MKKTHKRPDALTDVDFSYCAGCGHGTAHALIARVIDKLGIKNRTVAVYPVGCAVLAYDFFDLDGIVPAHGAAPAVATGVKRTTPECIVFTYQGDGDLAAIGTGPIIHTANRGENITTIFINNGIYGMTGGQMAPTTLLGQKTTTTPEGRKALEHGDPLRVCELLDVLQAPVYLARVALTNARHVISAEKAVKTAFQMQIEGRGFSFVEILSACPVGWKLTPIESLSWMERNMFPYFPIGEFRKPEEINA